VPPASCQRCVPACQLQGAGPTVGLKDPEMSQIHPDLPAEQAHIDHAYACLEQSKEDAWRIRSLNEADRGGTFQARYERNAFDEQLINRLTTLELGDAALVFGRIDRLTEDDGLESFHIGRLAVADGEREPVVVDWRAPVAEPFYRATGREPMGLARRRHFAVDGRHLLGIEDELFGEGHLGIGHDEGLEGVEQAGTGLRGYGTLLTTLARGRTGQLGDIVATIQAEQDEIIRSNHHGVLVVQGGPGTGKTVVALHRAAYLLYTHRFPLEDQGVLVLGPNRVFLRYIERVLPSLGEAGVEQAVLADLVTGHRVALAESHDVRAVKGDIRMVEVIAAALRDRQRPLREDFVLPFGAAYLRLTAAESARIVREARRRYRRHNAASRWVENEIVAAMAASGRNPDVDLEALRDGLRDVPEFRTLLARIWPILTPAELLHDLFGSRALLKSAGSRTLLADEWEKLHRPRSASLGEVNWSDADVALLDEALALIGPRPRKSGRINEGDEVRQFGHIVIDEVQDYSPMQLRMVARRSLNGAMTVVGDLAQATGAFAPDTWDDILRFLPDKRPSKVVGLSVGYRIPAQIMDLANRVMHVAAPGLRAPRSVREGDSSPAVVRAFDRPAMLADMAASATALLDELRDGNVAVVCADSAANEVEEALRAAGLEFGRASTSGLDARLTVVPVGVIKGLELDGVVVVEPSEIVAEQQYGMRALYVALTRSTRRLTVVHCQELPAPMVG
jgi:DNA helicase IV